MIKAGPVQQDFRAGAPFLLLLVGLGILFVSRPMSFFGAPAILNFLHFVIFPSAWILNIMATGRLSRLDLGIVVFLFFVFLSAVLNAAGAGNVVLGWLLLVEPFMVLSVITARAWGPGHVRLFWWLLFAILMLNVLVSHVQYFALGLRHDDVKGIFPGLHAGHHVHGAMILAALSIFWHQIRFKGRLGSVLVAALALPVVVFADAKQAVGAFILAILFLVAYQTRIYKFFIPSGRGDKKFLAYWVAALAVGAFVAFILLATNIGKAHFGALYVGILHKLVGLPITLRETDSFLNILFGMGPGHTFSRFAFMIPKFSGILGPVVTTSPITQDIWIAKESFYFSKTGGGSSIFSPFYSLGGTLGDLGLLGFASYMWLWLIVWIRYCKDDPSALLVVFALVLGGIFLWLEEPQFAIYLVALIGLSVQMHWQRSLATIARAPALRAGQGARPSGHRPDARPRPQA